MKKWWLAGAVVISALLFMGVASGGCSSSDDPGSGTTGRTITLKTQLTVKGDPSQESVNALGWTVRLSEAYLSIGPLYYYSGAPVLSLLQAPRVPRRTAWTRFGDWLVKPAYAHPGHYIEGAAMGQMLESTTVDLLAGTVVLGIGEGITGSTNSARFTWQAPPQGDLAPKLAEQVVRTVGLATRGDVTLRFIAQANETQVRDGDNLPQVAGCAFGSEPGADGVIMNGDGTVTLTVAPQVWFDQVDFAVVAPGAPGAPAPASDGYVDIQGTSAWQGFVRGLKKGTGYQFSYVQGEVR